MVAASELVVVAKVTSVRRTWLGKRVATAEVIEAWKGSATRVEFLAEPTWMCDVADAKEGETAVLFLLREKPSYYFITHSGRGRMPLRETDRGPMADFWPEVRFPEDTPTHEGPDKSFAFIRSVELEELRELVRLEVEGEQ